MSKKHAYLIMAHNNESQLIKLIELLDDPENDIYLHIDAKSKQINCDNLMDITATSQVFFTDRIKVAWGGYSQIKAELILLKAASKNDYLYYHLISGADLPIKPQNVIHKFFDDHYPTEYIGVEESTLSGYDAYPRVGAYHLFQDTIGRGNSSVIMSIIERLENYSLTAQKKIGINRLKNYPVIYKGPQWFSITNSFAQYILANEQYIYKHFRYGACVDEMFLQTLVMTSSFHSRVNSDIHRLIHWDGYTPHIWTTADYNLINSSNSFWARKFDEKIDNEIIELIYAELKNTK